MDQISATILKKSFPFLEDRWRKHRHMNLVIAVLVSAVILYRPGHLGLDFEIFIFIMVFINLIALALTPILTKVEMREMARLQKLLNDSSYRPISVVIEPWGQRENFRLLVHGYGLRRGIDSSGKAYNVLYTLQRKEKFDAKLYLVGEPFRRRYVAVANADVVKLAQVEPSA